jgi:hypothetical protein
MTGLPTCCSRGINGRGIGSSRELIVIAGLDPAIHRNKTAAKARRFLFASSTKPTAFQKGGC